MSRHLPPLRAIHAFEAIARLGSVSDAAEELSLTPSAISHRLRRLEEHLNVQLFYRANRRMILTDVGREYLQTVASAFNRIEQASERIVGGMASDVLTVHCPPSFAPSWLLPRIKGFMDAYPTIDLRIHASPEPVDFFKTSTDCEIRYGSADWTGLDVFPLMADSLTPLCTPDIKQRICNLDAVDALSDVPLIFSERAPIGWGEWFRGKSFRRTLNRGLYFDRGYLALQAAAQGLGVALESTIFAEPYLKRGELVRLFEPGFGDVIISGHALVYPPVYREVRKIALFRDWIVAEAQETVSRR
ncbi:LysR family transcriptional regulator [Aureimonas fodinaquatilis]|uniref:LysR family transcriptional regulator n=1 Tax=Aureimonas fodinaquatilis TaxID=2565783 RepID=A0A5B0DWR2_9HYPH|nr:LysR substrate-binding domain-containing protein [Aureimonas fodinaquatilis]KAA0971184.1 LysR family transcriptional regulator [Aureimonas fodinaquatilis]